MRRTVRAREGKSTGWKPGAFVAVFVLVMSSSVLAAATKTTLPAKPTTVIEPKNCVTDECHGDIKNYAVVHGPVAVGTCDACHELTDAAAHRFRMSREKAELCTFCHEFDTGSKPVVHHPVTKGECLGCHNPHGGKTRSFTREGSVAELCGRCHEDTLRGKAFLHSPVKQGECDSCHAPHASNFPKLLDAVGTDMCLTCHGDFDRRMAGATFRHKALEEGCEKCHDAHGAAFPMAVREPISNLCLDCHGSIKARIADARDRHSVVMSDRACITCHTAHGGDLAKLMADTPAKICMSCHDQAIKRDTMRTVAAVAEINDPATFKHGPIREGQCGGCHSVHGGEHATLLDKPFFKVFYQRFNPGKYELCLKCHDARIIGQPAGYSNFRNGEKNLHYVHVIQDKRGHHCTNCHETHAGGNDRIVRAAVKFGKWQMPIGFTRTETGGTCQTGCHLPWAYDRENPVPVGAPLAATTQPRPMARAARDEQATVEWMTQDLRGADVIVPDSARPTVLLMVGPEPRQRAQVLRQAALALPDTRRAQVIVVLCGPQSDEAPSAAAGVAMSESPGWPIVTDAGYALCGELGVHGWPTTLVIRPDGAIVARISGAPESLALRLPAYVDLAMGKLAQTPPKAQVVGDGVAKTAHWQVQMARKLLDEDQPERAHKLLAAALKVDPPSLPLRAAMVETLAKLNRGAEAAKVLKALRQSALPPGRHDLLRAKVLLAQAKREEAKTALAAATKAAPDLSEAHLLLATLHEQDQQWQQAAESYRAYAEAAGRQ